MPVTEAKKRASRKWDAENMATVGCKLKKEDAELFKEKCKEWGTTPSAVLREAVELYIQKH